MPFCFILFQANGQSSGRDSRLFTGHGSYRRSTSDRLAPDPNPTFPCFVNRKRAFRVRFSYFLQCLCTLEKSGDPGPLKRRCRSPRGVPTARLQRWRLLLHFAYPHLAQVTFQTRGPFASQFEHSFRDRRQTIENSFNNCGQPLGECPQYPQAFPNRAPSESQKFSSSVTFDSGTTFMNAMCFPSGEGRG